MQSKYSELKITLIEAGYLPEAFRNGRLWTKDTRSWESTHIKSTHHKQFVDDFKLFDALEFSDETKYRSLLGLCQRMYLSVMKEPAKEEFSAFINKFKAMLDKSVNNDNDMLSSFLSEMSSDLFKSGSDSQKRSEIAKQLYDGEITPQEANEKLIHHIYDFFLSTEDSKVRQQCLKLITAFNKNLTDLEKIDDALKTQNESGLLYADSIYYDARCRTDKEYDAYRKTLEKIRSTSGKENIPNDMNIVLQAMALEANQLYQDKNVPETTKASCHSLLLKIDSFSRKVSSAKEEQKSPEEMKKLSGELMKQAEDISQSINRLSAATSSKRWGRILSLAFGTLGIGLFWIIPSLKSDSTFFKLANDHHTIVNDARKIIERTHSMIIEQPPSQEEDTENRSPKT